MQAMQERNVRLAVALARDGRPKYVVAAAARVSPNVLSAAISGRLEPTRAQRARIAAALGMSEAQLFGEAD